MYDARFQRQLEIGGRLFVIVGEAPVMEARLVRRVSEDGWVTESLFETVVAPLMNARRPPRSLSDRHGAREHQSAKSGEPWVGGRNHPRAAAREAGTGPLVLDVREGWELESPAFQSVLHIPMSEIPGRLGELDANREIVVMCRSGGRSMQVAQFLARNGFQSVANLTGGILAWSRDVDPSVPAY